MVKASRWEIVGAWLQIWTPPRDVEIAPVPRRAAAADAGARVRLACLAMSSRGAGVTVAQPFAARASLRDGRYAWCHENPRPAEGAANTGVSVPLPAACRPDG